MDNNLDLDSKDTTLLGGQMTTCDMNQSDLVNNQMANQQVPGYHDDYHGDQMDDGHLYTQNQSSFSPSFVGKEVLDASLSDSNQGFDDEEEDMIVVNERDERELMLQSSRNPFQADLLTNNQVSIESNKICSDDFFAPNNLSEKPSAQTEHDEYTKTSQPPDHLVMDDPTSTETCLVGNQPMKRKSEFEGCETFEGRTEDTEDAIENDFYNEGDENYDDEYVDSEESDYSDEYGGETGPEQVVPEICDDEEPPPCQEKSENIIDLADPNVGASGFIQSNDDFTRNEAEDQIKPSNEANDFDSQKNEIVLDQDTSDLDSLRNNANEAVISEVMASNLNSSNPFAHQMHLMEADGEQSAPQNLVDTSEIPQGVPKGNKFTIESDDSDLEERSLTPDPNQLAKMNVGSQFQTFEGDHKADQVQISGLVEGTLMEESEDSEEEDITEQNIPEEKVTTVGDYEVQDSHEEKDNQLETVSHPIQEKYEEEEMEDNMAPVSEQAAMSVAFEQAGREVEEPVETQIMEEPLESQMMGEPVETQIMGEPIESQMMGEPVETQIIEEPLEPQMMGEPEETQIMGKPEESQMMGEPEEPQIMAIQDDVIDEKLEELEPEQTNTEVQNAFVGNDQNSQELMEPNFSNSLDQNHGVEPPVKNEPQSHDLLGFSGNHDEPVDELVENSDEEEDYGVEQDNLGLSADTQIPDQTPEPQVDIGDNVIATDLDDTNAEDLKYDGQIIDGGLIENEPQNGEMETMGEEPELEDENTDVEPGAALQGTCVTEPEVQGQISEVVNKDIPINETTLMGSNLESQGQVEGYMYDSEGSEEEKLENEFQEKEIQNSFENVSNSFPDNTEVSENPIVLDQSADTTDVLGSQSDTADVIGSQSDTADVIGSQSDTADVIGSQSDTADVIGSQAVAAVEIDEGIVTQQGDGEENLSQGSDSQEDQIDPQMRESGMEGSFVLEEGQTFDDKNFDSEDDEYVQSSPEEDIPANSIPSTNSVHDENLDTTENDETPVIGQNTETEHVDQNNETLTVCQNTESIDVDQNLIVGQNNKILDFGQNGTTLEVGQNDQTIDDDQNDESLDVDQRDIGHSNDFCQNDTSLVGQNDGTLDIGQNNVNLDVGQNDDESSPESDQDDDIPVDQTRETGMEGSFVLDEGETLEDKTFGLDEETSEYIQSTPEVSPDAEVPVVQKSEPVLEGISSEGQKVIDETMADPGTEQGQLIDDDLSSLAKESGIEVALTQEREELEQSSPEISPEIEIPPDEKRESGMEGSFVLEEGETFDDKKFGEAEEEFEQSTPEVSPEDEIPPDEKRESGMEGSFVLEEGETFDDKKFGEAEGEFEQSTPEVSPEDEIPPDEKRESGMEGSFVLEEGETFDDKKFGEAEGEFEQSTPEVSPEDEIPPDEKRESGMEGSFVLEEGETFDDKKFGEEEGEFEQSTPEISPESENLPEENRESGMEGSFVLEEGETFGDDKFGGVEEEFEQSTPEISPEQEFPVEEVQEAITEQVIPPTESGLIMDEDKLVNGFDDSMKKSHPVDGLNKEETVPVQNEEQPNKIQEEKVEISNFVEKQEVEEMTDVQSPETPSDSYGDIDSAIQSPLSQDDMVQSPTSDVNEDMIVEQENQKNLMSSSFVDESEDQNQVIETYQNGVSHSASEEATPDHENSAHPFQNGISHSASDESPEKEETKAEFDLVQSEKQADVSAEVVEPIDNKEVLKISDKTEVKKDDTKTKGSMKKIEKTTTKKTTKFAKTETIKKDVTRDNKKDATKTKDTSTKTIIEKRSYSSSRVTATPPSRPTRPTTSRLSRDTTRKSKPEPVSDTTKPVPAKSRPKSIDISRTSSLTRPTMSSLNKARDRSLVERTPSPTKPMRNIPATSRYRVIKSKKDGSSDSGLEEDKSPKKAETQTKSQDGKVTPRSTSAKRSTIPTMNRSQPTKSEGSPRKTPGKTTPTKTTGSKIGSLDNSRHTPGGGQVKIQSTKTDYSGVTSRIGSKDMITHKPAGGEKKILSQKLEWKAESKVGSLKNATHSPGGGKVKIQSEKLAWNAQSRVGSLGNANHTPGGGHVKIRNEKITWKAESRVKSLDNAGYVPGGGNVHIPSEKIHWRAEPKVGSLENTSYVPGGGNVQITNESLHWNTESRVDSLSNSHHTPGGGNVKIQEEKLMWSARSKINSLENQEYTSRGGTYRYDPSIENKKLDFKDKAQSKVGSKDYLGHKAGGGDKKIETQKLHFKEKAHSKVGSKDYLDHKPGGGDKKIDTQKLTFKESAKARTDSGTANGKSRPDSGIESENTQASV